MSAEALTTDVPVVNALCGSGPQAGSRFSAEAARACRDGPSFARRAHSTIVESVPVQQA
jgi:hypothetical protein